MIARLNPIFLAAEVTSNYIAITGAVTAFFAATIGLFQTDIKKSSLIQQFPNSDICFLQWVLVRMKRGCFT